MSSGGPLPISMPELKDRRTASLTHRSIFPPANSIEPALSASDFFAGKTARPKVIDLETRAVSTSEGPIPSAPSGTATPAAAPSLPPSETAKSKSAPADYAPPTKEEPKPAAKQLEPEPVPAPVPSPAPAPVEREPDVQAKSLEIEQPESDDETPIRTPPKEEPAPASQAAPETSSNGTVTAVRHPRAWTLSATIQKRC